MKNSPILRDHVKQTELIASFGAAKLVQRLDGKMQIQGGSEEDREAAREWVRQFLGGKKLVSE